MWGVQPWYSGKCNYTSFFKKLVLKNSVDFTNFVVSWQQDSLRKNKKSLLLFLNSGGCELCNWTLYTQTYNKKFSLQIYVKRPFAVQNTWAREWRINNSIPVLLCYKLDDFYWFCLVKDRINLILLETIVESFTTFFIMFSPTRIRKEIHTEYILHCINLGFHFGRFSFWLPPFSPTFKINWDKNYKIIISRISNIQNLTYLSHFLVSYLFEIDAFWCWSNAIRRYREMENVA